MKNKNFYHFKNLLSLLWSKVVLFFGYKYSEEQIPEGQYCYKFIGEIWKDGKYEGYNIEKCKYYKTLGSGWNGCMFDGIITDDMVFDDQCKMCGIKRDFKKDKEND